MSHTLNAAIAVIGIDTRADIHDGPELNAPTKGRIDWCKTAHHPVEIFLQRTAGPYRPASKPCVRAAFLSLYSKATISTQFEPLPVG
jgi:hypothetical protein